MKNLVDQLVKKKSPFHNSIIFFHNGGRFDVHLIYAELIRRKMPPECLAKGMTFLYIKLAQNKVCFKDTLQFMPGTPLSAFPKNFGLESGPKGTLPPQAQRAQVGGLLQASPALPGGWEEVPSHGVLPPRGYETQGEEVL